MDIDEQQFRDYYLGRLDAERQEELERRYFADAGVLEALEGVELDLLLGYAGGTLPQRDKEDFERAYLTTARARRKLAVIRAMRRRTARRPVWAAVAAGVALAVGLGLGYWMAAGRPGQEPVAKNLPVVIVAGRLDATVTRSLRSEGRQTVVRLTAETDVVRLEVFDPAHMLEGGELEVRVVDEDKRVLAAGRPRRDGDLLVFDVAARPLAAGDYAVIVFRGGQDAGMFPFLVVR